MGYHLVIVGFILFRTHEHIVYGQCHTVTVCVYNTRALIFRCLVVKNFTCVAQRERLVVVLVGEPYVAREPLRIGVLFIQLAHGGQVEIEPFELSQAATAHFQSRVVAGMEFIFQVIERYPRVDGVAACEKVDSRISVLRPCVYGQVAFLYHDHTRYAVRGK